MASLTEGKPRPTPDPSYIGASREPERKDFDRSGDFSTLFSGVSDVINQGTKAVYQHFTGKIADDVYARVDPTRDETGVGTATFNSALGGKPLDLQNPETGKKFGGAPPPDAKEFEDRMRKLYAAKEAGKLSDTHYYANLDTISRSLRSKYPGFREEVDDMIQKVTGVTPANALRKSIQSDLETASAEERKKASDYDKWVDSNAAYLPPDFLVRKAKGNPYSELEAKEYVRRQLKDEHDLKWERDRIALNNDQGKLNIDDAEKAATKEIDTRYVKMSTDAMGAAGGLGTLQKRIVELSQKGQNVSPQEQQELAAAYNTLEVSHRNMVDGILTQPFGKNGETYASIIGPEKTKKIRDNAIQRVADIKQMLVDGNTGAFFINQQANKAMADSDGRRILEQYPVLRNTAALGGIPGMKDWMASITSRADGPLNDILTSVNNAVRINRVATGGPGFRAEEKSVKEIEKTKGVGGVKALIDGYVTDLSNPAHPKQVIVNTAKSIFSEDNKGFMSRVPPSMKTDYFTRLVSPQVTKNILESGDPEVIKKYTDWAKASFFDTFKAEGDTVRDSVKREWWDVKFNTEANQFQVIPTAAGIEAAKQQKGSAGYNPMNWHENRAGANMTEQINKMNRGIKALEPIMKHEGYDVGKEMGALLNNKDFIARGGKQSDWWDSLRKAWDGAYIQAEGSRKAIEESFGGKPVNFTKPSGGKTPEGKSENTMFYAPPGEGGSNLRTNTADIKNLNPSAQKLLDTLVTSGVVEDISVKSGFRDPVRNAKAGGAKASRHIDGSAIDLDISHYSDEEKAAVLEKAIEAGAKGIGVYPGGRSLHIDTRETPATWGYSPFGAYRGVHWSSQPEWAHKGLKKLFGEEK